MRRTIVSISIFISVLFIQHHAVMGAGVSARLRSELRFDIGEIVSSSGEDHIEYNIYEPNCCPNGSVGIGSKTTVMDPDATNVFTPDPMVDGMTLLYFHTGEVSSNESVTVVSESAVDVSDPSSFSTFAEHSLLLWNRNGVFDGTPITVTGSVKIEIDPYSPPNTIDTWAFLAPYVSGRDHEHYIGYTFHSDVGTVEAELEPIVGTLGSFDLFDDFDWFGVDQTLFLRGTVAIPEPSSGFLLLGGLLSGLALENASAESTKGGRHNRGDV